MKVIKYRASVSLLLAAMLILPLAPELVQSRADLPAAAAHPVTATTATTLSRDYPAGSLIPPGPIDNSEAEVAFTVLPGDFHPNARVKTVTLDLAFSKVDGLTCPGPTGGTDWAEEVGLRLSAPGGTFVTLVDIGAYQYSNPDVGPVSVTFDDTAPTSVAGRPIQSGAFHPTSGWLADFAGLDPAADGGVWTLILQDTEAGDVLCFLDATLHITVSETADLAVTASSAPDPVHAGELMTYQVTVTNSGPDLAPSAVVTGTLPSEIAYLGDSGSCTWSLGAFECPLGDISAGSSRTVKILTRVSPDAVAATPDGLRALSRTFAATATATDPNPDNNTAAATTFVTDLADLRVTKLSAPHTNVAAGETFTYTLFVDNTGPSFARGVILTDTILSSGAFTLLDVLSDPDRADSCDATPAPDGTLITCALDAPLEPDGDAPGYGRWQIQMRVRADQAQQVTNRVEARSATPDPDPSSNVASSFTTITAVADLGVTASLAGPVAAGETAAFYVTLWNAGPSTAHNVVLVNELPAGLTPLALLHPGMACSLTGAAAATITCGAGTMEVGAHRTLTVTAAVDPDLPGGAVLINSARISADEFDADNTDNYATVPALVISTAALSVARTGAPDPIPAGEALDYTIALTNAGPATAHNVVLHAPLPTGVAGLSAHPHRGTCGLANGEIACQLDAIPPGETVLIDVQTRVDAGAVPADAADGTIQLVQQLVASASNAPAVENRTTTTVVRASDVAVRIMSSLAMAYPGDLVRTTLTTTNAGPSDAANVILTATLPLALDYELSTGDCDPVPTAPGILRCALGEIPARAARTLDLYARVRPDATPYATVGVEAVVTTAPTDPEPANNRNATSLGILGRSDLRVTQYGHAGGQIQAGEELTHTLIVDNLGPGYAHEAILETTFNAGGTFELLSVMSDRAAACSPTLGTFTQTLALRCELAAPLETAADGGGRWIVHVAVRASEGQTLESLAEVTSADADPDLSNNQATVHHAITDVADLRISAALFGQMQVDGSPGGTLSLVADQVTAGAAMTYTLTLTNAGPSTARNVVVQDRLPGWIQVQAVTPSRGACNMGTPGNPIDPLVCGLGTLAPRQVATVRIAATIHSDIPSGTLLDNNALVYSDVYDPDNGDNFVTQRTRVDASADLAISKTVEPTLAFSGERITYTITIHNHGPSDAAGATVTDVLPAGIAAATWSCTAAGGATCDAQGTDSIVEPVDVPAGGRLIYVLQGTVTAPAVITNTATVTGPAGVRDPHLLDNTASAVNRPRLVYLPLVSGGEVTTVPDLVIEALIVNRESIQILVRNQGSAPVTGGFWVDAYIDPSPAPRSVNQVWGDIASQGLVWGISATSPALQPGEAMQLFVNDSAYWADLSRVTWPLPEGARVYAQVDSYGSDTDYGLVLESHEIDGGAYNNITGPVLVPADPRAHMTRAAPSSPAPRGRQALD